MLTYACWKVRGGFTEVTSVTACTWKSYTGYNPVLKKNKSRVFLARNRMLTRVVAKQAKTKKVKNKFVDGKKKVQRKLSCLFVGRGKVQFRRKKLGDKVQAKSSNLPRRFCSNSIGTPLEFAAFRSGFDVKYCTASAFWFFCPQPWFLRRSEHILPGKTPAFSCW